MTGVPGGGPDPRGHLVGVVDVAGAAGQQFDGAVAAHQVGQRLLVAGGGQDGQEAGFVHQAVGGHGAQRRQFEAESGAVAHLGADHRADLPQIGRRQGVVRHDLLGGDVQDHGPVGAHGDAVVSRRGQHRWHPSGWSARHEHQHPARGDHRRQLLPGELRHGQVGTQQGPVEVGRDDLDRRRGHRGAVNHWRPPRKGCSAAGTRMSPTSFWWFSRIATITRGMAHQGAVQGGHAARPVPSASREPDVQPPGLERRCSSRST